MAAHVQPVNGSTWLDADHWSLVHDEVLRQCDALDGVTDGIINDPRRCFFRPETLACRPAQNTSACLTGPQIGALKEIYSDWRDVNNTCTSLLPVFDVCETDILIHRCVRWISTWWREYLLRQGTGGRDAFSDCGKLHEEHGVQHNSEHHICELDLCRYPRGGCGGSGTAECDEP
jgi:hypothetical protein